MQYNTRLVFREDKDHGIHGWALKRNKYFNVCTEPRSITHDILEHARNDKGTYHEEIAAFGAAIAYRGDGSDLIYPSYPLLGDKLKLLGEEIYGFLEYKLQYDLEFTFKFPCDKNICTNDSVKLVAEQATDKVFKNMEDTFDKNHLYDFFCAWLYKGFNRASKVIEKSGHDTYSI